MVDFHMGFPNILAVAYSSPHGFPCLCPNHPTFLPHITYVLLFPRPSGVFLAFPTNGPFQVSRKASQSVFSMEEKGLMSFPLLTEDLLIADGF